MFARPLQREGALWAAAARLVTRFPLATVIATMAILTPPLLVAAKVRTLYDSLEEYPPDSSFVRGAQQYRNHAGFRHGNRHVIHAFHSARYLSCAGVDAQRGGRARDESRAWRGAVRRLNATQAH